MCGAIHLCHQNPREHLTWVCEHLSGKDVRIEGIGIADEFVEHARQSDQRKHYGLDKESICKKIQNFLENHK